MLPLERGLIEPCILGDMVGYRIQFLPFQNSKSLFLDLVEWRIPCNTIVGKDFENRTCLLQVLVTFDYGFINTLFGIAFGIVNISSDVINQAIDQIVMEFLITVINKA
jgi:hypothetical protein